MAHQRGLACQRIVSQLRLREALRLLDGIVEIGERRQMTRLVLRHGQPEFIGAQLYEAVDLACTIVPRRADLFRSEEHTSELQSLMRISYAVFCLKKKQKDT